MEQRNIYDELNKFLAKYIPILSDAEFENLEEEISRGYRNEGTEFFGKSNKFGYKLAIFQSNAQDRDDNEKYSYYAKNLESIVMSVSNFRNKRTVVSIGSGLALIETFVAKEIFPNAYICCLDFSQDMCKEGKKIAENEGVYNIDFVIADANYLPFKKQQLIDVILSIGKLSFDKTSDSYKREIEQITNQKGAIIFTG